MLFLCNFQYFSYLRNGGGKILIINEIHFNVFLQKILDFAFGTKNFQIMRTASKLLVTLVASYQQP